MTLTHGNHYPYYYYYLLYYKPGNVHTPTILTKLTNIFSTPSTTIARTLCGIIIVIFISPLLLFFIVSYSQSVSEISWSGFSFQSYTWHHQPRPDISSRTTPQSRQGGSRVRAHLQTLPTQHFIPHCIATCSTRTTPSSHQWWQWEGVGVLTPSADRPSQVCAICWARNSETTTMQAVEFLSLINRKQNRCGTGWV